MSELTRKFKVGPNDIKKLPSLTRPVSFADRREKICEVFNKCNQSYGNNFVSPDELNVPLLTHRRTRLLIDGLDTQYDKFFKANSYLDGSRKIISLLLDDYMKMSDNPEINPEIKATIVGLTDMDTSQSWRESTTIFAELDKSTSDKLEEQQINLFHLIGNYVTL